jgi:putative two-component system response regulator
MANELMKQFPEYNLTEHDIKVIVAASPLHDIGKIVIPDKILFKPGKLNSEEFDYMKSHTLSGCEMIESIKDTWSEEYKRVGMEISHYHHERYDGSGYPEGLVGDEIPISAQLVSVADVYDALVHERVYKNAYPKDRAFRMIINGECGTFSPQLLECLRNCRERMEAV